MSGFSPAQLRKLTAKLERGHVHTRNVEGKSIDYIEGWFALSEANAIFGFGGWDRETVHFERLCERTRGEVTTCAYSARVRIRVRAGEHTVSREGTGCGTGSARNTADAHERAIKAAETDATKRALATFGNRFGLCLYDKHQAGVSEPASRRLEIHCPDGQVFAAELSPEGFCTALRKIVESTKDQTELAAWLERNTIQIARLRELAPDLKTQRGDHYADVLERLIQARLAPTAAISGNPTEQPESTGAEIADALYGVADRGALSPSRIALGPRIDKATLTFKTARRIRDKSHLRHVATLPCLVCQTVPSHAHHLTFAQPRGLALKVSDEFVVPLCAVHHNDVHRNGAEYPWWKRAEIEPLAVAHKLWSIRSKLTPSDRAPQINVRPLLLSGSASADLIDTLPRKRTEFVATEGKKNCS